MYQILLLIIVLIVFALLAYKKEAFTGNTIGLIASNANEQNKQLSTMLYFSKDDEETYLNKYQELHPIDQLNEPLIMDRCIQFVYEGNNGGIDGIVKGLYADNKMFVSEKIAFDYSSFSTIENKLKDALLKLYVDSNKEGYVPQFYGPCYVMITQYPYMRTIKKDCTVLPRSLQWDSLSNKFSPKPIDDVNGCESVKYDIANKALRCEMYILMPTHTVIIRRGQRLVGPFTYKKWPEIRCNMRRLFAYNKDYKAGVYTIDPRSFDDKCQLACLNESDNTFKYACGARNSINNSPYESTVLGTRTLPQTPHEEKRHDYANLYLINPFRMNVLLNMDSTNGIFKECITPEAIPADFNMNYSCISPPPSNLPTTPQSILKNIAVTLFNIRIGNDKCIAVTSNNQLTLTNCGAELNKRWFAEPVTITGEGEPYYRIGVKVSGKKLYLVRDTTIALNSAILTNTIPTTMAFKPRTNNQLMLMDINPTTRRIDWTSNEKYCLEFSNNQFTFTPKGSYNQNISFVPISIDDQTCGAPVNAEIFYKILQSAKEQIAA